MKKIALATVMAMVASTAFSGDVSEPVVDVVEVVEDSSSSSGVLLPALAMLLIGALVASSD
ncbi:MAG: hypothetical protein P8O69_00915 [Amylibacter sp.]|nr:hypothetical protein [Amylibacter sp.]MDG1235435.1 hypothetical protein [Amylibacter sp.]